MEPQTPAVELEQQQRPAYTALAAEFPEIIADRERVQRGEKPQSAIFQRTSKLFEAAQQLDPILKNSLGGVYLCALMAREELAEEQPGAPKAPLAEAAIAREFPELVLDKELVARGRQPQSPLYNLTARLLNEVRQLDPMLGKCDGTVLLCARIARLQLELDGKKLAETIQ